MKHVPERADARAAKVAMKARRVLAAMVSAVALTAGGAALAAGGKVEVIDYDWSFEGPFGQYDEAQLQRGWQVYTTVCAQCHSLQYVHYRDLGSETGPNYPPEQVEAMAAMAQVPDIDDTGNEIMRPALPTDRVASPFPNREMATAAFGAYPPDLSLITRARKGYSGIVTQVFQGGGGEEYVYSVLMGYTEQPENFEVPPGGYYNAYYPGHVIKMSQPLYEGGVPYQDGTEATVEQMAADVTAFLAWAADPHMEDRKRAGFANLTFLVIFAVLLWFSTKKLWKRVKEGGDA